VVVGSRGVSDDPLLSLYSEICSFAAQDRQPQFGARLVVLHYLRVIVWN